MAPIGNVTTSFTLDKAECQGADPLTGVVSVKFRPTTGVSNSTGPGLFGHLKLRVVLQGRLLINVAENRTSHACIFFNEKRTLFTKYEELVNGSFRAAAKETSQFPFRIRFPIVTDAFRGHRDLMPPSFDGEYSAVARRQVGKHHGAALIEYTVRVEAEMPAIDVSITNETAPKRVLYQPPGEAPNSSRNEFSQTLQVYSYALLPEEKRPGLLGKTRARINSETKPSYAFTVTCVGYPEATSGGQELPLEVRIRSESNGSTTTSIPNVSLYDCKVDLLARTQCYATNHRGADSARIDGSEVEASLSLMKVEPYGPFKKEDDFTKKLVFSAIPEDLPSTFLIKKLGRSYKLRISMEFYVAEQKLSLEKTVNIRILPPLQPNFAPIVAGPSRAAAAVSRQRESDDLPSYYEIGTSAPPFQQHL